MATHVIDLQSASLGAYPSGILTRKWVTTTSAPVVRDATISVPGGLTREIVNTLTADSSRQADSVADSTAIDQKFRALVRCEALTGTGISTPIFAAILRGGGSSGSETGYAFTLTRNATGARVLGINRYADGTFSAAYSTNTSWESDRYYIIEGSISGTNPVVAEVKIFDPADPNTPLGTFIRTDSDARRIQTSSWLGIGRFAVGGAAHAYAAFATGADELPVPPWVTTRRRNRLALLVA